MHLYHLLILDPSISLFSICYCQLPFLFFLPLCLVLWILIPKETILLQVLPPQQHTRNDNYTPPPAQGILYSPSAPSLGWPHNLTLSSDSDLKFSREVAESWWWLIFPKDTCTAGCSEDLSLSNAPTQMQETPSMTGSRSILSRGLMQLAPFKWATYRINLHMLPQGISGTLGTMKIASGLGTSKLICLCLPLNKHRDCVPRSLSANSTRFWGKQLAAALHPGQELIAALGHEPTSFSHFGKEVRLYHGKCPWFEWATGFLLSGQPLP